VVESIVVITSAVSSELVVTLGSFIVGEVAWFVVWVAITAGVLRVVIPQMYLKALWLINPLWWSWNQQSDIKENW